MNNTSSFYIIAYDLHPPKQDYGPVDKKVMELEDQCKLLETTWLVKTTKTPAEILTHIKSALAPTAQIVVIKTNILSCKERLNAEAHRWINKQRVWQLIQKTKNK